MLFHNVGLNSKAYEEIANESSENCRFRQPHCRLTPLSRELREYGIPINLILPEIRIFVADSVILSQIVKGLLKSVHICQKLSQKDCVGVLF